MTGPRRGHVADYFRAAGTTSPDPPFYDRIPVRFAIADVDVDYHVPYRGR